MVLLVGAVGASWAQGPSQGWSEAFREAQEASAKARRARQSSKPATEARLGEDGFGPPALVRVASKTGTARSDSDAATAKTQANAQLEVTAVPPQAWGPPALDPAGNPGFSEFVGPPLVSPLQILDAVILAGTKQQLSWSVGQGLSGGDAVAPVHVAHGDRPGPVLCLAAAIHGDEINGVEIVRRVINDADPSRLSGTLIGVPIVNLFGFARGSRYLPDRRDLNRFFPGSARGSIASRMAYSFFQNVIRHCDALVDFHTGSFDRSNLPQIRADLRLPEVLRFARGIGAMPVLHSNGSRGMLRVAATAAGIPAVTFEVGAPGVLEKQEINQAHEALDALMHHMGMNPEAPDPLEPQPFFYESRWIRADSGGLLLSDVALGDRVVEGQTLGVVVDPIRNVERKVVAPFVGSVIGLAKNQVVLPGFAIFHIGRETSAEAASDAAATSRAEPEMEEDPDPEPRDPEY
ncbi:MAG: succinylglutamate desuccinylase/aspartoacylase family protein [Xanthomonadales bacterium]|nr:succinylglutamate desuccinylase/aspartoacylase family protein [Xanthomonadales bacterium]